MNVEVAVACNCILGEGPLWDPRDQMLYWVDIEGKNIHRYQPDSKKVEVIPVDPLITALGRRKAGGFIAAVKNGFASFDPSRHRVDQLINVLEDNPDSRFNDGAVDPLGRFWAGTYSKSHQPTSSLYLFDSKQQVSQVESGLINSNGMGWSPDGKTMYHTDTSRFTIYAYDFDLTTGMVENRRALIVVPDEPGEGAPDGLTVDSQGFIWSARFRGGKVVRYDPSGKIEREVKLPVPNVSSCTFGGEHLEQLFITTAQSKKDGGKDPLEGNLFVTAPGVTGLSSNFYLG